LNRDLGQFYEVDLFVISPDNPQKLLDYSSGQLINITLDQVNDPEELEHRIYQSLDYLVNLHQEMNLVNLDIKP
jgi:hypothetical protein